MINWQCPMCYAHNPIEDKDCTCGYVKNKECGKPCTAYDACLSCKSYWGEMRRLGYWSDEKGWTEKAMRDMVI